MKGEELKSFLDEWADRFNNPGFIVHDPITIPHRFSRKQDIEISGFFAAIMAWGNRTTIIKKCSDLLERMGNAPYDFIRNSGHHDLRQLEGFVHRTLNDTDVLFLVEFLRTWYAQHDSLEEAFTKGLERTDSSVQKGLEGFYEFVFQGEDVPDRTRKHIATPARKSACKRLNMFLRWMVRVDDRGVDFGIWNKISPSQLVCPLDVHVHRVATELHLLDRTQTDWKSAIELTEHLKAFDPVDPVRYDYALFGLGVSGHYK